MIKQFKELDGLFNEVKDKDESEFSTYETLGDGKYRAVVSDIELTDSKKGDPMVVVSYELQEGEEKGFVHKQFLMLTGKDETQLARNLNKYATTVGKLGVNVKDGITGTFEDFGKALGKQVILTIESTKMKNGNLWTNTSFELE